jgi:hypothetical protein
MSYEKAFNTQAELRIVRRSTIERKQMSTKTTFKRIALVTVAALGFGVMSVAPSSATARNDAMTLTTTTAGSAVAAGETATATVALNYITTATTDSISVTAAITDVPAAVAATGTAAGSAGDITLMFVVSESSTSSLVVGNRTATTIIDAGKTSGVVTYKGSVHAVVSSSAKAGTYKALVYTTIGASTAGTSTPVVWTFTVSRNSTLATSATSIIAAGVVNVAAADAVVVASKDLATQAAIIEVTQINGTNTAAEPMNVNIAGPGYISAEADTSTTKVAQRIIAGTASTNKYIGVYADGTAGEATITITGALSGVVLGVEKVTFADTKPAKIAVAVKKAYIAAGKVTPKVFAVTVTDASGLVVADATITGTRTDTTTAGKALASADLTCGALDATDKVYYCSATGASALKFGKAEYEITATGADTLETEVSAMASVTFSDIVATKVTITGPASANVGDKITYTLTATDANGYPVADTTYEGAAANQVTALGQFGGILWNTTTVPDYSSASVKPFNAGETITTVSGVATKDLYMPATAGTVTNTWTLAGKSTAPVGAVDKSIAGTTIVVTTAVTSPGTDAAAAAAEEATAAANDATDAALSAAEAAEAATALAQEAVDAVAELSASVTKLISALRAQITTLTNLVVKIQKKVKA